MDEPTTALDVVTQREILEELTALRERLGFAVLFITHDLSLLAEIADSIAVMYAGRLVERAAADELFRAPRHPYTLGLLNSFPALHGPRRYMTGIPGSPPDLRMLPAAALPPALPVRVCRTCRWSDPPPAWLGLPAAGRHPAGAACWLPAEPARPARLPARSPAAARQPAAAPAACRRPGQLGASPPNREPVMTETASRRPRTGARCSKRAG